MNNKYISFLICMLIAAVLFVCVRNNFFVEPKAIISNTEIHRPVVKKEYKKISAVNGGVLVVMLHLFHRRGIY